MHADVLVEKEVDAILRRCGLSSKLSCIQNLANEGGNVYKPLSKVEEMSPQALSGCLRTFYGLVMGNDRLLPEFEKLQEPKLRSDTCIRVARALSRAYRLLFEVITDPRNQYADPKSLVRHSPGQIKTICYKVILCTLSNSFAKLTCGHSDQNMNFYSLYQHIFRVFMHWLI